MTCLQMENILYLLIKEKELDLLLINNDLLINTGKLLKILAQLSTSNLLISASMGTLASSRISQMLFDLCSCICLLS